MDASGWYQFDQDGTKHNKNDGVSNVCQSLPVLPVGKDSYQRPQSSDREQDQRECPHGSGSKGHASEVAEFLGRLDGFLQKVFLCKVSELADQPRDVLDICHVYLQGNAPLTSDGHDWRRFWRLRLLLVEPSDSVGGTEPASIVQARRNITPLVAGQSISLFGDYVAFFTLPYFMLSLTGEALALGLTAFAETLPMLLFGLAAGVFLDRRRRLGRTLIGADIVRAMAFVFLAFIASPAAPEMTTRLTATAILAIAFLVGSMSVLFDSGLQSYMTRSLLESDLITANTRLGLARTLALSAGPLVGGLAVTMSGGFTIAFALNAGTFLVSAFFLRSVRPIKSIAARTSERFRTAITSGLRVLFADKRLRWGTIGGTMTNFVFQPLEALLVLFVAQEILGIDNITDVASREGFAVGTFIAIQAAIGSIGVGFAGRLAKKLPLGTMYLLGLLLLGSGFFAVVVLRSWVAVIPAGVAITGVTWVNVALVTMRQKLAPPEQMGRVIAASRTLAWAGLPAGAALGGILADIYGIVPVYVAGSLSVIGVTLLLTQTALYRDKVMADSASTGLG